MSTEIADDEILSELMAHARAGAPGLLQFQSLVSARQYLPLYRLWRSRVPAGAEVLDWGAGNGHFSYFLLRAGYRVTGYSFEPFVFESWLPAIPYRFVPGLAGDPVHLPFPDAVFDAVASVGVLEHVRETGGNEPGSLAEIARVLRPGGVFVCWHLPDRWSWIELASRQVPGKHHHPYRYARGDVRRLVADAGLELVALRRYGLIPRRTAHVLLGPARDSRWVAAACDGLDAALAIPLGVIAQNHGFVARKPAAAGAAAARSRPPAPAR